MNQKGQGALDFLMTYGWTILAALVSIAAFWQFGLLSGGFMSAITGMSYCALPAGIVCEDHSIGPSGVTLVLRNALPSAITSVKVKIQSQESGVVCLESTTVAQIASGAKQSFFVACDGLQNRQRFRGSIVVTYGIEGGVLSHTDEGSVASGQIEPSQICNVDNDGDTYYLLGSCPTANDCDDNNENINIDAPENTVQLCTDGKDNDCDNLIDGYDSNCDGVGTPPEGCNVDGDECNNGPCLSVLCGGEDCDDTNSAIHPPQEYENTVPMCQDLVDNDCDGQIDYPTDLSCIGAGTCSVDEDGDTYYRLDSCVGGNDCNDDPDDCGIFCFPGYPNGEICEDLNDNDCNGLTEEQEPCSCLPGCDQDGDNSCAQNCQGWNGGYDCADNDPNRNPYVNEVCYDGIDNNCNGFTDEFCGTCPPECDQDADSYCSDAKGCDGTDCDDTNPSVNPGIWDEYSSLECSDSLDNDCDGDIDCNEGCCLGNAPTPPGSSPIFSPLFKPECANRCGV